MLMLSGSNFGPPVLKRARLALPRYRTIHILAYLRTTPHKIIVEVMSTLFRQGVFNSKKFGKIMSGNNSINSFI